MNEHPFSYSMGLFRALSRSSYPTLGIPYCLTKKPDESGPGEPTQSENKLKIDRERVFEVAVVATMSSGKSTFINALIGDNLLPSQNQACTKRTAAVLDNDTADSTTTHLLFSDGKYKRINDCSADQVAAALNAEPGTISDIIIEGSIPGIRNIWRSLLIVDTPGANNAGDRTHEEITYDYLRNMTSGLIVYVMNAEQIGTYDDQKLLEMVRAVLTANPKLQIIFVLNKADAIDIERESLEQVMENSVSYLRENGFEQPCVFPISAKAALLFRKAKNGAEFTKREAISFWFCYERFRPQVLPLSSYVSSPQRGDHSDTRTVGRKSCTLRELCAALENTGLPAVEHEIENRMIDQLNSITPEINESDGRKGEMA